MIQIHYETAKGKCVILYPKSEKEVELTLKRLAYRRIPAELRLVGKDGARKIGGSEPLDDTGNGKHTWYYERGPFEMRI